MKTRGTEIFRGIVLGTLLILIVINAVWFAISKHSGSLWGLIAYLIILFLCWRQNEYRAGIAAGLLGFGVHLYELINVEIKVLIFIDLLFLCMNLAFPILLFYASIQANKTNE